MDCPLCGAESAPYHRDARGWAYRACSLCALIFREPSQRLGLEAQKERYALHQNEPADPAYRSFLSPAAEAVERLVPKGAEGLDFGCGPGPALAAMLTERGYRPTLYDPLYQPDAETLARRYRFVCCTETVEHFLEPAAEFARLDGLIEAGGALVIMTKLADGVDFPRWHYRQDETHGCFYSKKTMRWIAARFGWTLERLEPGLTVFLKPAGANGPGR